MSPLIQTKNLGKVYKMGKCSVTALQNINFNIENGEFTAIMGSSGSGKSTLMNLLGCLDTPSIGVYLFEDMDIISLNGNQLAEIRNRRIGFVFQNFNLLPRASALENIELPLLYGRVTNSAKLAQNALERVGLKHRKSHLPTELSGGERQRVAIARAIVNNPALLLADEPTGNLDSAIGEEILNIFHQLNNDGVTIILVTHEEQVAAHTNRVINMKDGQIINDSIFNRRK